MSNKSIKIMLLGIMVMLFGGFIVLDPASNLGGIELLIIFIGLTIGIFGMIERDLQSCPTVQAKFIIT